MPDLPAPALASSAPAQHQIVTRDGTGQVVDRVHARARVPTIHKREWWNLLLGNRAGYLPDNSQLERLDLDLPPKQYLSVGPDWLKVWHVPFFGVLLLASLAIKVAARIE